MNIGLSVYKLAFEKSPIFLTGGIAESLPIKTLPLIAITQAVSSTFNTLATLSIDLNLDDFYATFKPMAGATLHNNQIGSYPFANQRVAANAIIAQPLNISLLMNCSPRLKGGMISKTMTATALKIVLDNHNFRGGTYTVLTPSFMYEGCVMTSFKDVTSGESKHVQTDWQIDFVQPLTSLQDAQVSHNALMQKISDQMPSDVLWSGTPVFNPTNNAGGV